MAPELKRYSATGRRGRAITAVDIDFQRHLVDALVARGAGLQAAEIRVGRLERNYFSFTFPLDGAALGRSDGVYVKVPKADALNGSIVPFTTEDLALGSEEYASLVRVETDWAGADVNVQFVRPILYLREQNAIVTERAGGTPLRDLLREADLRGRVSYRARLPMARVLERIGRTVAHGHRRLATQGQCPHDDIQRKINERCEHLARYGSRPPDSALLVERVLSAAAGAGVVCRTSTLKGLDVRNGLVDSQGYVYFYDPGRTKDGVAESDLARFLATLRILHWGSVCFPLLHVSRVFEAAFLRGYYASDRVEPILTVLLVSELLKHWCIAHEAVDLRGWGRARTEMARRLYVDPFFQREVHSEIAKLASAEPRLP